MDTLYPTHYDAVRFAAEYDPITYAEHLRVVRKALRQESYIPPHDVLMERNADGTVCLLPAEAMPYRWRTMWRLKAQERQAQGEGA